MISPQVFKPDQLQKMKITWWTNQNLKQNHTTGAKGVKARTGQVTVGFSLTRTLSWSAKENGMTFVFTC